MKKLVILIALIAAPLFAQDGQLVKFSGFVRSDAIFDSRRHVTLREDAISLYPAPEALDSEGDDLAKRSSLTMLTLHTRLTGKAQGPDCFGAKTFALIEGEFFGATDIDANGFRLRHAYVHFDWGFMRLLFGQYWNPMFITDVLPGFNFNSPFLAYGRRPMLKIDKPLGDFVATLTASMQSDFKSVGPGPDGKPTRDMDYMRNAGAPSMNFTMKYKTESFVAGAGGDYKKLLPEETYNGVRSDETIESYAGNIFMKANYDDFTFKLQSIYGQNLPDVIMIGGYARKLENPRQFANINIFSVWSEISYGGDVKFCLLGSYTKNLGTDVKADASQIFGMGANVASAFRLAPSVIVKSGNVRLIGELEMTSADYGKYKNEYLEFEDIESYQNYRVSLVAFYHF